MTSVNCDVAARLILKQLKLDDLLIAELRRLQQQNYQQGLMLSDTNPLITSSHTASSHPASTPVSMSVSASSSQPFELPHVNISDLLNTTVQPAGNLRSPVLGYQRISSASPAPASTTSQKLSRTDRGSKKKAGNRKIVDVNCGQNTRRNVDQNSTATDDRLAVTKVLSASDSRKRQSSGRCSLTRDSDDEFQDLRCSNVAKRRVNETQQQDAWKTGGRLAVAGEVICEAGVESSIKQDTTYDITNNATHCSSEVSYHKSKYSSVSMQQPVAQRLSKFAFKNDLFRQRQQSSATDSITCVTSHCEPSAQQDIGN